MFIPLRNWTWYKKRGDVLIQDTTFLVAMYKLHTNALGNCNYFTLKTAEGQHRIWGQILVVTGDECGERKRVFLDMKNLHGSLLEEINRENRLLLVREGLSIFTLWYLVLCGGRPWPPLNRRYVCLSFTGTLSNTWLASYQPSIRQ